MPIFSHPAVLLLIPPVLLAVAFLERAAHAPPRRRLARGLVRGLVLCLLVAAFAGPQRPAWRQRAQRLVVAVDRSLALDVHGRREALELARAAADEARALGAAVTLLGFADRAAAPWTLAEAWPRGPAGPWPEPPPAMAGSPVPEPPAEGARARPAAALAAAQLAFAPDERGTILLLTSGRGASAGLAAAARHLEETGIRLRAAALPFDAPPVPPGVAVVALDLPPTVRGAFDATAQVRGPGAVEVELLVDGRSQGGARPAPAGDGPRTVTIPGLDLAPGVHEVALVVRGEATPAALERRLVLVEAPPRIVLCVVDPETSPTRRALSAQGFRVVAVPAAALPAALAGEGVPPDALVLDAATVRTLPPETQRALVARVEQGLGLFLEAGASEEAWTALAEGPLGRILPLTPLPPPPPPPPAPPTPTPETPPPPPIELPEEDDAPGLRAERRPDEALPISLMLVIDRSGSMRSGGKLAMAIEGARRAAATLSPADRVSVVTFADESTLDIPPTPIRRIGNLGWRLAMLQAGGNTDIFGALIRATSVLERETAPIRHMILLTDGGQNTTAALFSPLMQKMTAAGITLTALGLGRDHDEFLLKRLVQFSARGRYRSVDGAAQLPTILTRDTQRVAEYREREVQAMARIEDPSRPPEARPPEPPTPEQPSPRPPGPGASPPDAAPPATPPGDGAARAPLVLLRPHEATRGLDPERLPAVGAPRRATPRRGAALLLARGDGEPVLAARRWGLGRTLVWALPPDAPGVAAWPDLGRVFVQGVRSVRAPKGAFDRSPTGRIVRTPDGERLLLDPAAVASDAGPVRVTWTDASGERDLGAFLPGQEVALPAGDPGAAAMVRLARADGTASSPPLTYLTGLPAPSVPRAGDAAALAAALGPPALDRADPLLPPAGRLPDPTPLWPLPLALALLLLPPDAALHRRARPPREVAA